MRTYGEKFGNFAAELLVFMGFLVAELAMKLYFDKAQKRWNEEEYIWYVCVCVWFKEARWNLSKSSEWQKVENVQRNT